MKMTFPHLGNLHTLMKLYFNEIGIEVIMPSANSDRTLALGASISPDEICMPFKLMAANIISAYEKGADTVVMPATIGPCRLGEYGELLKNILDKRDYILNWIILDTTNEIGFKELAKRLNSLVAEKNCTGARMLFSLKKLYDLTASLEKLERKARILCGYEDRSGACKSLLSETRRKLLLAKNLKEGNVILRRAKKSLGKISLDKSKNPIKILLTGEIYTLIEPFASHHIEECLMDMGISFKKNITIGWWVRSNLLNPFYLKWHHKKKNVHMPYGVGGYAKETVEDVQKCRREGCDGAIQILPVGCMPEIVAKSVLSQMAEEDEDVKVLTIIFDEMSGDAGIRTRLEAFTDMLEFNGKRGNESDIYGNRRGLSKHGCRVDGRSL